MAIDSPIVAALMFADWLASPTRDLLGSKSLVERARCVVRTASFELLDLTSTLNAALLLSAGQVGQDRELLLNPAAPQFPSRAPDGVTVGLDTSVGTIDILEASA